MGADRFPRQFRVLSWSAKSVLFVTCNTTYIDVVSHYVKPIDNMLNPAKVETIEALAVAWSGNR